MKIGQYRPDMSDRRPALILGLCDSHDSGVALIREGRVLAAINEERLSRQKMCGGFPAQCLTEVWKIAGVQPNDVSHVAVAGSSSYGIPPINNDFTDEEGRAGLALRLAELIDSFPGGGTIIANPIANEIYRKLMRPLAGKRIETIKKRLRGLGVTAEISAFDHHTCHIASAYYTAGEPDCLVISNDGFGDAQCSQVAIGEGGRLRLVSSNTFYNSLGVYYNYITHFCGFSKGYHAGKTTGLAAHGDADVTLEIFRRLLEWDSNRGIYVNRGRLFRNCLTDLYRRLEGISRADAAAGIQAHCEEVLESMVEYWMRATGLRRLALVGGVHANVKANQRIAELPGLDSVFVFPNMGDGGLALGAAFLAWPGFDSTAAPKRLETAHLGPTYSEGDIEACLREERVEFDRPANLARTAAEALGADKIVARFDGRMEYGPRALGNRSILYSATNPDVNGWLNRQLGRTEFMPFAPVLRHRDAPAFLKRFDERTAHTAEFMTITYDVTERCKREAPAVVHVDGTARPQVLRREVSPGFYDILDEYHALTGLSVLVNTSFNMHEEPIVCTPKDAIRAFFASNLDMLIAGPFVVENHRKRQSR